MEPYELLDHEADVGVRGWGTTVEEAFEHGAEGMFSVMVDIDNVNPDTEIIITVEADDLESLFVEWLNELLAQKDIVELVFSEFSVDIKENETILLTGKVRGEPLDVKKHEIRTEVKAATYFGLKSGTKDELYYFQCVLDI
ncbi:MAG: archease [Candidatus Methanofastidiosia archaeon]|jgi:SHS2 domain-containing protein